MNSEQARELRTLAINLENARENVEHLRLCPRTATSVQTIQCESLRAAQLERQIAEHVKTCSPSSEAPRIRLTNVTSRAASLPFVDNLQGRTMMSFIVEVCPVGGSFDVVVTTRRPETSEEELMDALLSVLSDAYQAAVPRLRACNS